MRNFNEIFRKDVTLMILKVTKNQGFTFSLEDTFIYIKEILLKEKEMLYLVIIPWSHLTQPSNYLSPTLF